MNPKFFNWLVNATKSIASLAAIALLSGVWLSFPFGLSFSYGSADTADAAKDAPPKRFPHPLLGANAPVPPAVTRATFQQTREIKGMRRPLRSSGQLLVSAEHGLWWRQEKPFALTLVLTPTHMSQTLDGSQPEVVTAASNPRLFQFNKLLVALFRGDAAVLEKSFRRVRVREAQLLGCIPDPWLVELVPTVSPLDKVFKKITLTGFGKNIECAKLEDTQGDITQLFFSKTSHTPLTDDEKKLFGK